MSGGDAEASAFRSSASGDESVSDSEHRVNHFSMEDAELAG